MARQIVLTLATARTEWTVARIESVIARTIEGIARTIEGIAPTTEMIELKTDNRIDRIVSKTGNNISRIVWIAAMRSATTPVTMLITITVGMEEISGARTHAAGISIQL